MISRKDPDKAPAVLLLLWAASLACGAIVPSTPTPVPTSTPLPTNTPLPTHTLLPTDTSTPLPKDTPLPAPTSDVFTVTYSDDFSDPDSGWPEWSFSETDNVASVEYADGDYVIKFTKEKDWWMHPAGIPAGLSQASVAYTVKNPLQSTELYFGAYCGYKDEDNYHLVLVNTGGYYRIVEKIAGESTVLSPDDSKGWAKSEEIPVGASTYQFRMEYGWENELVLFMNGTEVIRVSDIFGTLGDIALYVGTYSKENSEIRIDDFSVGIIIG
jgi:hypothetical protein